MQEWYLGWEKVSCLERCPQFRSVLMHNVCARYCIRTISGESQLIADNGCILIVPVVITYCTIPPSNTHLNSTSGQFVLDKEIILSFVY